MKGRIICCTLIIATYLITNGCINLGPDYQRPELETNVPQDFQYKPVSLKAPEFDDRWWEVFGDSHLNQLVEDALKYNWDIKKAAARVLETRARYVQVRSERFPEIGVSGTFDRRRTGGALPNSAVTRNTWQGSAPASFEIDLWSRLKKASLAAWDDILQAEANRWTVAQAVVAETISLYLRWEAIERRLEIAAESIDAFQKSLQFVETRYKRGLISVLDVRQARRILAGAEALVPQFEQDLGITQQQIAILVGRYPKTRPARVQPEEYYERLAPVPPGLPSDLLLRRPDIRAVEARLMSLNEQVGVAKAARFPSIRLTGSAGWSSEELNDWMQYESFIWNLGGSIVHSVFNAGRLKAGQRAAEARYEQGATDYINAVLTAFGEVEGALLTREKQLQRRERELNFLVEARATQRVAENRYIKGLVDYLNVFDAQQVRFQAEDRLVLVDLAIYTNRVTLHRALGGGWAEPAAIPVREDGPFFQF
jgi:multidrug efflux system outer membrane protein